MLLGYLYSKKPFCDDYHDDRGDHAHGRGVHDYDDHDHDDHDDHDGHGGRVVSVSHANELRNNLYAYVLELNPILIPMESNFNDLLILLKIEFRFMYILLFCFFNLDSYKLLKFIIYVNNSFFIFLKIYDHVFNVNDHHESVLRENALRDHVRNDHLPRNVRFS